MGDLDKVIACMKELKRKPKVESFEDKLIIQKSVCLLELMGFDMGYRFSLYVRGPYSPDLTGDIYAHRGQVESLKTGYAVSSKEKPLIEKLLETSNGLEPAFLEIMATYAFLTKSCGLESRRAVMELKRLKPFYSETKIAVGVSRAKELFPLSEKEMREMKAEFAEIENAALSDMRF